MLIDRMLNIGIGLPEVILPVNVAGGVYNTFIIK